MGLIIIFNYFDPPVKYNEVFSGINYGVGVKTM